MKAWFLVWVLVGMVGCTTFSDLEAVDAPSVQDDAGGPEDASPDVQGERDADPEAEPPPVDDERDAVEDDVSEDETGDDTSGACGVDAECEGGTICVRGRCVEVECVTDADCDQPPVCRLAEGAACNEGRCTYLTDGGREQSCDDGDPCTISDACVGDACVGAPVRCEDPPEPSCNDLDDVYRIYSPLGRCEGPDGECVYEVEEVACPNCAEACAQQCQSLRCPAEEGGCRLGVCAPGLPATCRYEDAPTGAPCPGGFCLGGGCEECAFDAHCDDNDPCTNDICADGTCTHDPADGAACTGPMGPGFCADGACAQCSEDAHCDDGNPCTNDVCGGLNTCLHQPNALSCELSPGVEGHCRQGVCHECLNDAHCAAPQGVCFNFQCVQCRDDSQCFGVRPYCGSTKVCRECVQDAHCDDDDECTRDDCNILGVCAHSPINGVACGGRTYTCASGDVVPSTCFFCQSGVCARHPSAGTYNEACEPSCNYVHNLCGVQGILCDAGDPCPQGVFSVIAGARKCCVEACQ